MVFTVLHYIVLIRVHVSIKKSCNCVSHTIPYYIPPRCCEVKEHRGAVMYHSACNK